nr:MAG TPA: hypothetical protein [Inoviridae sp.]
MVGGQEGFYFLPACHVANAPGGSPKAIYRVCNLINWTKY